MIDRVGWGYSDLAQFGSLFDKGYFFHFIDTEKVDSFWVNHNLFLDSGPKGDDVL